MTTAQKTTFAIVANVAFLIPSFMRGAFNDHHCKKNANLKKLPDNMGMVLAAGVVHFGNRQTEKERAAAVAALPEGYKLGTFEGVQWAMNAQRAKIIAGRGALGQALFTNALSVLTQSAKSAAKTTPKTVQKAPTSAATLPAKGRVRAQVKNAA